MCHIAGVRQSIKTSKLKFQKKEFQKIHESFIFKFIENLPLVDIVK